LKIEPNNVEVLVKLGEVLLRQKDTLEEAEAYLTRAIDINPLMSDGLITLGRVKEKNKQVEEAIDLYERAINVPGNHIHPLLYLALIYSKQGDDEKTDQYFKRCIKLDKDNL
jgi:tetratricopeptide (TPR) repeat protein